METLNSSRARLYASIALSGVSREWPHHYQLLANGPEDIKRPRELHPAFYGCYDWHSAVHSHWTLARLHRLFPHLAEAGKIRDRLNAHLTPANIAAEVRYFEAPGRRNFERPYGWAWLLALAAELRADDGDAARRWAFAIEPLETLIVERFCEWLPRLRQPIRTGLHTNTAFGMTLALDYARSAGKGPLESVVIERAKAFFGKDRAGDASWEPGGADFLSPVLTEADLMRRVLGPTDFEKWRRRFLPRLPVSLRLPADPGRWRDAQSIHLDGLNLSRAWALWGLAEAGDTSGAHTRAAALHAKAGLSRVASGDYLGEHWLASFAVYLLTRSVRA